MAAMVVLAACAAQASYTYTWTMTIDKIPSSFTKLSNNAVWYLVDTKRGDNGTVLCYNTSAEYGSNELSLDKSIKMTSSFDHTDESVTLGNVVYNNDSHKIFADDSSIVNKFDGDIKSVTFQMKFTTETNLGALYGKTTDLDNLTAYLYDPDYALTLKKTPVAYANSDNVISFTSKLAMMSDSSVPEPTSGLLVLFGLAGLALKRKRAA